MNILPKKNWHVRTKKNIERVRKDEAQAAEEEQNKLRKIALAEQEARTDLMRSRARAKQPVCNDIGGSIGPSLPDTGPLVEFVKSEHINLFEGSDFLSDEKKTNDEHEKEKKDEKEKYEKSIGLLTYLGQSAVESQTSKPWYVQPETVRKRELFGSVSQKSQTSHSSHTIPKRPQEEDLKKKRFLDPLHHLTKYVEMKDKIDKTGDSHMDHVKKHRRHRTGNKELPSASKTVEQLRAERLQREKTERLRAEQVLAKARGETVKDSVTVEYDDRKRSYNSQYNPDLARRPKLHKGHQKDRDYN